MTEKEIKLIFSVISGDINHLTGIRVKIQGEGKDFYSKPCY